MKDLSLHILDIVQNSIVAGANLIQVEIVEDKQQNTFTITISDNGSGMDKETLEKVTDPYFTSRTTRKVGLGLPLFKQNAERTGGHFQLESEPGKGTKVTAVFVHDNLDRPVLGDIAGVMVILAQANPFLDFVYSHQTGNGKYIFDTCEVKEMLEDMPISNPQMSKILKEMIQENLKEINAEM